MPLARFDNGRFFWTRPPPAGVAFDSAVFVGRFLYASSGMDVWRTAFREPRAAWTRLLAVEVNDGWFGRPRTLRLLGTETVLYACGRVRDDWSVMHIYTEDGRAVHVRYGVRWVYAAATRFYEGTGTHALGARICVRGAGDALLEVHTVQSRSVLVARPGSDSFAVPLPVDVDGAYITCVANDVICMVGGAGVMHYWISTRLAVSRVGWQRYLSPRLFLHSSDVCGTFYRSTDPERRLPLPERVSGYQCRVAEDGPGAVIAVNESRDWARVRKNAHCTLVWPGHKQGDVSGDYIAGADGQGKLALFWHVPLGTSLDILLGAASGARERDARASNSNLVKALRLGTVRVLLGLLLGA